MAAVFLDNQIFYTPPVVLGATLTSHHASARYADVSAAISGAPPVPPPSQNAQDSRHGGPGNSPDDALLISAGFRTKSRTSQFRHPAVGLPVREFLVNRVPGAPDTPNPLLSTSIASSAPVRHRDTDDEEHYGPIEDSDAEQSQDVRPRLRKRRRVNVSNPSPGGTAAQQQTHQFGADRSQRVRRTSCAIRGAGIDPVLPARYPHKVQPQKRRQPKPMLPSLRNGPLETRSSNALHWTA
ncbi:hypothetical protein B0H63DRAFT_523356 [Podospora didyma]|uniref:Uncharacterized protein n=1 Tax=Podospora didyma TaxID=330526 RepID=A0AAE0NQY2_9PEZI|nr:hypothetical protein B0H63DRAFT_523356 [Podospora didyma]